MRTTYVRNVQYYDHETWYNSPEYQTWHNIHTRILNPKTNGHEHYKGLKIDKRYRRENPYGFQNFLDDMGPRPKDKETIDRIDGRKGYIRGNMRWATWIENQNNRTFEKSPKWKGVSVSTAMLGKIFRMNQSSMWRSIKKFGLRKLARLHGINLDRALGLA